MILDGPRPVHSRFIVDAVLASSHRNGVGVLFLRLFEAQLAPLTDTSVYASSATSRRRLGDFRPKYLCNR